MWQLLQELNTEFIHSDYNWSTLSGVPSQDFTPMAQPCCLIVSELSMLVCFCSPLCLLIRPCHLWDGPHMQLNCLPPRSNSPPLHNLWAPFHLGCQNNEGLISIPSLISLFTALRVNADSNSNKQLLNMSLTLLGLQMRLCYWDYSVSCSFVMGFVNHSWPAVYRMKLRLSSFFLWLLSFFPQRITILLPERLITCTNKRVWDINTKFTGFSLSQTCNSLYISSW